MKTLYTLIVALFVINGALAQTSKPCFTCLPQGIDFTSQSQIDNFQINYPNCTHIAGNVEIGGDSIYNLNGLSSLDSIGGWLFIWTDSLSNLTGLEGLKTVSGGIAIEDNHGLNSLAGLSGLTSTYFLSIRNNTLINNLSGLDSLNYIETNLTIFGNGLSSLSGLNNLDSIGGDFFILEPEIIDFNGLDELVCIGGDFDIVDNWALTSLAGLENLTSIRGYLNIGNGMGFMAGNPVLASLTGLEGLTSIGGTLFIIDNEALTSLTGLDNIESNTISELYIAYNALLSTCAVQSICDYLANPSGTVLIVENATGCNSEQEVEDACATLGAEYLNQEALFTIYPNPASIIITIETLSKGSLFIHKTSGQHILQHQITEPNTTIDVSGWESGVYVVKVVGDKEVIVGKFVKQ